MTPPALQNISYKRRMIDNTNTIQDNLLVRVIFANMFVKSNWKIYISDSSYHVLLFEFLCLELSLYVRVHIVINIGKFSEKSPITKTQRRERK